MSLTQLAVCVLALWLVVESQTAVSSTLQLIFGLVALGLVAVEVVR